MEGHKNLSLSRSQDSWRVDIGGRLKFDEMDDRIIDPSTQAGQVTLLHLLPFESLLLHHNHIFYRHTTQFSCIGNMWVILYLYIGVYLHLESSNSQFKFGYQLPVRSPLPTYLTYLSTATFCGATFFPICTHISQSTLRFCLPWERKKWIQRGHSKNGLIFKMKMLVMISFTLFRILPAFIVKRLNGLLSL